MRRARVIGPIEGTRPPWGAPRLDLGARGYVCEEYQLEGTAVAYRQPGEHRPPINGRWSAEATGEAPYRTRILVVRPRDPLGFNGTVVVHWQNVSAGFEMGRPESDELYAGYAWVGVSAQEVGLYGSPMGLGARGAAGRGQPLVDVDPERYGALVHPGEPGSFEIFGQAAGAVGPDRDLEIDPLGGLDVRRLIGAGASQSAMRLVAYANGVHPLHHVLDGYLLSVWEGRAPRLDEGPIGAGGLAVAIRDDLGIPVVIVNSEFEATATVRVDLVDTEWLRIWEVTGTAHAPGPSVGPSESNKLAPNPLSWAPVHDAALGHLYRWLAEGIPAPVQPRIAVNAGPPASVRRDERGNALGGIRLPELAVPIGEYRGMSFGTGHPPLFGGYRPFHVDEFARAVPRSSRVYGALGNRRRRSCRSRRPATRRRARIEGARSSRSPVVGLRVPLRVGAKDLRARAHASRGGTRTSS